MRSAKLLIVAYKTYKRGEPDIAAEIFGEAMKDESAPALMEELFTKAQDEELEEGQDEIIDEGQEDDDDDELEGQEEDELEEGQDDELNPPVLSEASIRKLRGIANRIAAEDKGQHRDIARRLLKTIRQFEKK